MARNTVNLYCPFCGIILFPDRYLDRQVFPATHARPWYAEIRAVYSTDISARQIAITGRGLISKQGTLYAPRNENLSYFDAGSLSLEKWPLCRSSKTSCAFGFHGACWRLLLLRLGYTEDEPLCDKTHVVESVFFLLYCTPFAESRSFDSGQDYGCAVRTYRAYGPPRIDQMSHLYADPFVISSLSDLETTALIPASGHPSASDVENPPSFVGDDELRGTCNLGAPRYIVFSTLSLELRLEILSYLSFDELLNARFVCRNLAQLARMVTLPRSYWRSRFLLGQEADFLFANLTEQLDWKRVFFGTRASLSANTLPLINRKRIRILLEPIAALVQHAGDFRNGPTGPKFTPAESQESAMHVISGDNNEDQSLFLEITSVFYGDIADIDANNILHKGCRVLYHKAQPLVPPGQQCLRRIGMSFVRIGARRFISGLYMPSEVGVDMHRVIGYRIAASEQWIEAPPASSIPTIWVAFRAEGLTAFGLEFADSHSQVWCPWASAGLEPPPEPPAGASSEEEINRCCIQSYLWATHPPIHEGLSISALLPEIPPRRFEPVLNIDFGGQAGVRLGKLTRFVFYMASRPVPFVGLEVGFSDGEPMLFGSRVGCAMPFFIDGAGGERIVQVAALRRCGSPNLRLAGLQLSTNYERTATFAPLDPYPDTLVENIPLPTPDSVITGHSSRLIRVGIQTQECSKQPIAPQMLDHDYYHFPPNELRYDHDHFADLIGHGDSTSHHTYASLKHIRRISASTGVDGGSRSSRHICGLKFDYYNHSTPEVVGQWMEEPDDGFELASDEDVRLLTIWLKPVRNSGDNPAMEPGQVVSVHIETTHARSVTFRSPGFDFPPAQLTRHQHQSDVDGSLIAIIWMLNLNFDCIRAIASPIAGTDDLIFVPDLQPPYDQILTIYFDRASANGSKENVMAVEAYFRDRTITGLDFVYTSGRKVTAGDLESDTHQTYSFPPNARIIRMSATTVKDQLTELQFEIERETDPTEVCKLVCSIKSSDDPIGDADPRRDVWRGVVPA
ncbi:hypothetical protein BJX65DRAFT_313821 [Aspergillus insuetus]